MVEHLCIRAIWQGSDPQMRRAIEAIGTMLEMRFPETATTEEIWLEVLRSFATTMDLEIIASRLTPLELAGAIGLRPERFEMPPRPPCTPGDPSPASAVSGMRLAG